MHQVEMVDYLYYLNCIILVKLQCTIPQKQLFSIMVNLPFLLGAFTDVHVLYVAGKPITVKPIHVHMHIYMYMAFCM